jgi:hypothetical protein
LLSAAHGVRPVVSSHDENGENSPAKGLPVEDEAAEVGADEDADDEVAIVVHGEPVSLSSANMPCLSDRTKRKGKEERKEKKRKEKKRKEKKRKRKEKKRKEKEPEDTHSITK